MQFKTPKLKRDFNSKGVLPYLRACVLELDRYCQFTFHKSIIMTCLLRDPKKQVVYCKKGNFKSRFVHCGGGAGDIRTLRDSKRQIDYFSSDEIRALLGYCRFNLPKVCFLRYHTKGTAPHLHLELTKEFLDTASIWAMVKNENAEEWFIE